MVPFEISLFLRSWCPLNPIHLLYFQQDFSDLHAGTLQVVANCLSDSESLQLIHKDGGLKRLMEFVLTPNTPAIQSNAVNCITRVAHSCKHRRKQEVLVLGLEFTRAYLTRTFSLFHSWCEAENRKLLHEQNVEKVLVELLSVADISVQTATCQAVSVMSFHLASKDSFRDLGTHTFTQQH